MTYRNPELTAASRRLRRAAGEVEIRITHTKAMEILARMDGLSSRHAALPPHQEETRPPSARRTPNEAQLVLMRHYPNADLLPLPDDVDEVDAAVTTGNGIGDSMFRGIWVELGECDDPRASLERIIEDARTVLDAMPETSGDEPEDEPEGERTEDDQIPTTNATDPGRPAWSTIVRSLASQILPTLDAIAREKGIAEPTVRVSYDARDGMQAAIMHGQGRNYVLYSGGRAANARIGKVMEALTALALTVGGAPNRIGNPGATKWKTELRLSEWTDVTNA